MNRQTTKDHHRGRDRWTFLITFLSLGALITGAILMVYNAQSRENRDRIGMEEEAGLVIQEELILRRVDDVVTDILYLTRTMCLAEAMRTGDYSRAEQTFLVFAESKKRYAQLRYLDVTGLEVIRINTDASGSVPVPPELLQDKSGRYYFTEGIARKEGEIYASPLDLNIENGEVEIPYSPMIRFASPVYLNSELRGLIVINYPALGLLEELREIGSRTLGDFYLLNSEGYYLCSPDEDDEWSFMFPDEPACLFPMDYPESWKRVTGEGSGNLAESGELLTRRKVYPLSNLDIGMPDYHWVAVNRVDRETLKQQNRSLRGRLFLLGGFLFLLAALPSWIISLLVSRTVRQRRELVQAAKYDKLTGLPNRNLGMDRLEQALALTRRHKLPGVLYFVDLDGFKSVNDNHGHDAGDALLAEVGRRLKDGIRESDTAARFGGDEFFVLVPQEEKDPAILAGKLIDLVSAPYRLPGVQVTIGASIGIRRITGAGGETSESLIHDADAAMYVAKSSGKGCFRYFDEI